MHYTKECNLEAINKLSELCSLEDHFKKNEALSECLGQINDGQYLCVRLDGIGLSKKYLKDELSNTKFDSAMWQAFESTYKVLHRKAPTDAQNIFLAALVCSDEISIILNSQKNYFEGRLFKTVTTVASTFSSFFTRNGFSGKNKKSQRIGGAFDGRPLVFSSLSEVSQYMSHRYAIYVRNSSSKALRLSGVNSDELYAADNFNNLEYYKEKIELLSIDDQYNEILSKPIVFIPNESGDLINYRYNSLSDFIVGVDRGINKFDSWLSDKCA
jgi:tRNA(His) 5'-end guanylyltransferase